MTTRGINKQRQIKECTLHVHVLYHPPCLSLHPLCLSLCFDKQSKGKPCRTLRHLSSKVWFGKDDHFAVTMLSQHKKADSMLEKATCSAHCVPLQPIFPLLRWEDGGAEKPDSTIRQGPRGRRVFTIDM